MVKVVAMVPSAVGRDTYMVAKDLRQLLWVQEWLVCTLGFFTVPCNFNSNYIILTLTIPFGLMNLGISRSIHV